MRFTIALLGLATLVLAQDDPGAVEPMGDNNGLSGRVADEISRGRLAQAEQAVTEVEKDIQAAKAHLGQHEYPRVSKEQPGWWPKKSFDPVRSEHPQSNPLSDALRNLNGNNGWDEGGQITAWKTSQAEDAANKLDCDPGCAACHKSTDVCSSCVDNKVFFLNGWHYGGSCVDFPSNEGCIQMTYPSELSAQTAAIKADNPVLHTKACTSRVFGQQAVENSGDNLIDTEEDVQFERFLHATVHQWSQTVCRGCEEDDSRQCSEGCFRQTITKPAELCYVQGAYFAPNSNALREFTDWDCMNGEVKEMEIQYPASGSTDTRRGTGEGYNSPANATLAHCCYAAVGSRFSIPSSHPWLNEAAGKTLLNNIAAM